jgi:AcrR family transcriptional regulator
MGRPQQHTNEEILEAARECLLEHGPGVSTTLIAERAGISQASLFQRFGSKEELTISALIPFERPPWADEVEAGPGKGTLRAELEALVERLWKFMHEITPRFTMLRASGIPPERFIRRFRVPPPVHARRALAEWFTRADGTGLARVPNPEHMAMALMGALHGRAALLHMLGEQFEGGDDHQYLTTVVDLIFNTINPEKKS